MRDAIASFLTAAGISAVVLLIVCGNCAWRNWKYEQCMQVGYSKTGCDMEYYGCTGNNNRRRGGK